MYEDMNFNAILQRMTDRVIQQNSNLDVREGSVIWNALAPAAVELTNMYVELDLIINETFADTASREMLIKRAAERGITPEQATKAILKGMFNIDVPIGARFSLDALNYVVTEKISAGVFRLECETYGSSGNESLGILIPIDYIDGLTSAELTEVIIPGEDEEATEALRQRYFDSLDSQAFGGNITDYKMKTKSIPGVGGVKVYPVWNGGGTVKLVFVNSDFEVPSGTLVNDVQTLIDPVTNAGEGVGIAPIGHVVTVEGATSTTINIATTITYESGWTWVDVEPHVQAAVDSYFRELSEGWENTANIIVRISQIETRLLGLNGIVDVANTTVNGGVVNLTLGADSIPIRGTVNG